MGCKGFSKRMPETKSKSGLDGDSNSPSTSNKRSSLAYPVVFVHGKLGWFSKPKENIPLTTVLVPVAIIPDG